MKILIVDDEQTALDSVRRLLRRRGLGQVETCDNGGEAIERIKSNGFDVVLLDYLMPETDGLQVLEATKPFKPDVEFIMVTAMDDVASAVKAIRLGAYDYLVKPVDVERLCLTIEHAFERRGLKAGVAGRASGGRLSDIPPGFEEIVTASPRMLELLSYVAVMARSDVPFLITGESGTGKELLARGVHRSGLNPDGPFVAVNVASIPETLFESHFFGHVRGAFTGADRDYKGYFEQADGGTLFLDEIGEMPLDRQARLLRVLETKEVTRLGETSPIQVDVRIVSATNRDLSKACQEGKFRMDLLYRLQSGQVHLPPLRERREDIPLLAERFLQQIAAKHRKEITAFSSQAMEFLTQRDYPGNIRELTQLVQRGVLMCQSRTVTPQDLGDAPRATPVFERTLCSLKKNYDTHIVYVLTHTKGNRKAAADILGITVRQLQRKIAELKADPDWQDQLHDL